MKFTQIGLFLETFFEEVETASQQFSAKHFALTCFCRSENSKTFAETNFQRFVKTPQKIFSVEINLLKISRFEKLRIKDIIMLSKLSRVLKTLCYFTEKKCPCFITLLRHKK